MNCLEQLFTGWPFMDIVSPLAGNMSLIVSPSPKAGKNTASWCELSPPIAANNPEVSIFLAGGVSGTTPVEPDMSAHHRPCVRPFLHSTVPALITLAGC